MRTTMEKEKNELQDKTEQILSEVETLAKAEYEVARLKVIDNSSRLVGSLLLTICIILVAFAVLSFCAAAAVFALALCVPAWAACLIVGAVYLLLIPVLILCSKALFIDPIVRKLSGLRFVPQINRYAFSYIRRVIAVLCQFPAGIPAGSAG